MKVVINKSKIHDIILKYLDDNFYPDYNWGPELHKFYREDVKRHGSYDFVVNDVLAYSYWDGNGNNKLLEVMPLIYEQLDGLFGGFWEPIFIKWFEKNSGLPVVNFDRYKVEQ